MLVRYKTGSRDIVNHLVELIKQLIQRQEKPSIKSLIMLSVGSTSSLMPLYTSVEIFGWNRFKYYVIDWVIPSFVNLTLPVPILHVCGGIIDITILVSSSNKLLLLVSY